MRHPLALSAASPKVIGSQSLNRKLKVGVVEYLRGVAHLAYPPSSVGPCCRILRSSEYRPFSNLPDRTEGRWGEGLTSAKMAMCHWLDPFIIAASSFWNGHLTIDCVTRILPDSAATRMTGKLCEDAINCMQPLEPDSTTVPDETSGQYASKIERTVRSISRPATNCRSLANGSRFYRKVTVRG